jgi:SpoVK/Ycf46/Vps4 family AAA+-type ATPase
MEFSEELDIALRSRFTLIGIKSFEEERILESIKVLCEKSGRQCYLWDHADFFHCLTTSGSVVLAAKDPISALEHIEKINGEAVIVLRDFHQCWHNQPRIIRKLRSLCHELKYTRKTIIVTYPSSQIPEELKDDIVEIDLPLPDAAHLKKILNKLLKTPGTKFKLTMREYAMIIQSALGLSSNQAQRVFARAIVSEGVLNAKDIEVIKNEKKMIIKQSGALDLFLSPETIEDVGGLEVLKKWLRMRKRAFTHEAQEYGLPAPKGIALIGIPGTGKSLTAKMIANLWDLALIRLDIGALFGSLVGQSEERTRHALNLAEAVAPCVLWIDEIEKGLSTGNGDGGTSMRVFGTILSWMQEKTKPVFIVATSNNIDLLPPELLRRGRFDEIFFLDLPTKSEREEIFRVHIKKRNRNPKNFEIAKLADSSEGYVGAEIEQAITEAMYTAFNDPQNPSREFTTGDIMAALSKLIPLSKSQKEIINALRDWMIDGRAQSASFIEAEEAQKWYVDIQLDPVKKIANA